MRPRSGLSPSGAPRDRRGFTLVEIMVALAVSGVALLGARLVLVALADQAERISDVAATADRAANGERLLRELVGRLHMGVTSSERFAGTPGRARFASWCDLPDGGQEQCGVELSVARMDSSGDWAVVAALSTGEILPLLSRRSAIWFLYLADATNGGVWFESWGAGVTPPLAIGVAGDGDTLIVRIGERG